MGVFDKAIISPDHASVGKTARGDDVTVIARAGGTNGALGAWTTVIAPGTGPDWHAHSRETELFHVISGSFRFWCGSEVFDAGPGTTVIFPPNIPHQWKNIGTVPGQLLAVVTPGGFEQNFIDIAALDAVTEGSLSEIDNRLGIANGPPAAQ